MLLKDVMHSVFVLRVISFAFMHKMLKMRTNAQENMPTFIPEKISLSTAVDVTSHIKRINAFPHLKQLPTWS